MAYKIKLFVLGVVGTNCYLLYHEDTKEAILFDPAETANVILDFIKEEQLKLKAILLTHGHFDHIGAAEEIAQKEQVFTYAHELEKEVAADTHMNCSSAMGRRLVSLRVDRTLSDKEEFDCAGFHIRVLHTPGHTPGGVCYYIEDKQLLFSGDTLFAGSVGRTDFPKGSHAQLIQSIKEKVMTLPDEVSVFPGHGEQTTIGFERLHNPFIV